MVARSINTVLPTGGKATKRNRKENEQMDNDPFQDARGAIEAALDDLNARNTHAATRSRELSLAITNFQQGLLWLNVAPVKDEEEL